MKQEINPRPGVVVALTDRYGGIAVYDPNAYRRRDWQRAEKQRREAAKNDKERTVERPCQG